MKGSVTIPISYIIIGVIIVVAILGIFVGSKLSGRHVEVDKSNQIKKYCPYECCINESNYENRVCQGNYYCDNNKCVTLDSDGDGLTDIEEREFGSNPNVVDTDSDGLNDYAEKQLGTDPNNQNTDSDRYNDVIDPDPTTKNSAIVDIQLTNKVWAWNFFGLLNILRLDLDANVATVKIDLSIENSGTDYTEYVNFDVVLILMNSEITRDSKSIGKLNKGKIQNIHYEYELKVSDIPDPLKKAITEKSKTWDIQIQNINYEEF